MSYYKKQERNALLVSHTSEKALFQALTSADSIEGSVTAGEYIGGGKSPNLSAKKHSSATLLRRKLKGHLVREFQKI